MIYMFFSMDDVFKYVYFTMTIKTVLSKSVDTVKAIFI